MRTDNPVADAAAYYYKEKLTYDYKCEFCKDGFDSGFGVKTEDDYFCSTCHQEGLYVYVYQSRKLTSEEIHQLTITNL